MEEGKEPTIDNGVIGAGGRKPMVERVKRRTIAARVLSYSDLQHLDEAIAALRAKRRHTSAESVERVRRFVAARLAARDVFISHQEDEGVAQNPAQNERFGAENA